MNLSTKLREVLRYLLVGGCAVLVDTIGYVLLSGTAGLSPSCSKRVSFTAGAIWAFFANKFFTFRQPVPRLREPAIFLGVYAAGFLANSVAHDLVLHVTAWKASAFLVATGVSTVINFVGQKWLVFRTRTKQPAP